MGFSVNSQVALSDFGYKPIDKISLGEYVLCFASRLDYTDRRPLNMTQAIYTSTKKAELIQWELSNGRTIQLTADQQILGYRNKSPSLHWTSAGFIWREIFWLVF